MKRSFTAAVLLIASFFIISAYTVDVPKPAEGFQNLKILPKDISKQALDSIMGTFSVSLGVRCNFCHAANKDTTNKHLDFASDAKEEKQVARYMMTMTDS